MKSIAVTAEFLFKSAQVDVGLTILKEIIKPSQLEQGCLFYELYKADNQKDTYMMIERWESHEDWQHHLQSAHIHKAAKAIQLYLQKPILVRSFSESVYASNM